MTLVITQKCPKRQIFWNFLLALKKCSFPPFLSSFTFKELQKLSFLPNRIQAVQERVSNSTYLQQDKNEIKILIVGHIIFFFFATGNFDENFCLDVVYNRIMLWNNPNKEQPCLFLHEEHRNLELKGKFRIKLS